MIVFTTTVESDLDYICLDIDAEQLVASLFGDDDSFVNFEQPPTDRRSSHRCCLNGLSNRIIGADCLSRNPLDDEHLVASSSVCLSSDIVVATTSHSN